MNTPTSTWNVPISISGSGGKGLLKGSGSQITH
jgi:hypothetical protein